MADIYRQLIKTHELNPLRKLILNTRDVSFEFKGTLYKKKAFAISGKDGLLWIVRNSENIFKADNGAEGINFTYLN